MTQPPDPRALLDQVIPFQFLAPATREVLAGRLEARRFAAGEVIMRSGERSRELYLLAAGRVEVIEGEPPRVRSLIEPGHFFGERAALFDDARGLTVRAAEDVVIYALPAVDFLRLIDRSPTFAQALSNRLILNQGIFQGYRQLWTRILQLIDTTDGFLLAALLPAYRALQPALHPLLHHDHLDLGALAYAVARLPDDVTSTGFYYLTLELPPLYKLPDDKFERVYTKARRRLAWTLMPSRTLVLLRDGITDITDLLTCLCAYAVEARKIRLRASSSELLTALNARRQGELSDEDELARLSGLADDELAGLRRIWGEALWARLHEILLHHEDIALEGETLLGRYSSSAAERWVTQVRSAAAEVVDLDQPGLAVHLISSNTHSVGNCLSPYIAHRRDIILAWGRENHPELCGDWANPSDLLYTISRHYIDAVPGARAECMAEERASGHYRLSTTAYTGISVDLICAQSLDPKATDPALVFERPDHPTLIVNVDYAFGQQAEEILANLLFVFGKRVRSVSVLGKAGGLLGQRGDLLLPRATLLQTNDELYPLPNPDLDAADLQALIGHRAVHEGPVLTVPGTLLQDRQMLHFYKRIWKCVGLEMEGSFFARRLIAGIETGIVRPDVKSRFAYYVSDVPLNPEQNLSEALAPWEGVPPLYAITRAVLQQILSAP